MGYQTMSENIEKYNPPDDENICGGCHLSAYQNKHGQTKADCCRMCKNISFTDPILKDAQEKDSFFLNRLFCTKLGLIVDYIEVCNYFEKS